MIDNMHQKNLSFGIIFLFISVIIIPTISGNILETTVDTNIKPTNKLHDCFKQGPGEIISNVPICLSASLTPIEYDNDGDMDFIAGTMNDVFLVINNGGIYRYLYIYELPDSPDGYTDDLFTGDLTSADYNNDGKEDFITGGTQGVVRLFINNCSEADGALFDIYEIAKFGQTVWGLTSADFDGDGNVDFAVSSATSPFKYATISIFYNDGNAEFTQDDVFTLSYDNYIKDLDSGDYDNDGDIDLIITYNEYKWYWNLPINVYGITSLLFNDGDNNFGNETMIAKRGLGLLIGGPWVSLWLDFIDKNGLLRINPEVTSADYDMDGDIDLLLGDNSGKVEIFENDGTGSFTSEGSLIRGIIHDFGELSWGLASADFDGDGDIDFIVATSKRPDYIGHIYLKRNQLIPSDTADKSHGKDLNTFDQSTMFSIPQRILTLGKNMLKKVFEPAPSKAEYHEKHAEENDHVTNNLVLTRDEMEMRQGLMIR